MNNMKNRFEPIPIEAEYVELKRKKEEIILTIIRIILLPIVFPIALGKHIYDFTWGKISKMFH